MSSQFALHILSDIHYASEAEQRRVNFEYQGIDSRLAKLVMKAYRHYIWQKDPFAHNHLLDHFLQDSQTPDLVVANGDYSCDSAFIGLSDDASFESAAQCLGKLRHQFGDKFRANFGDHEFGKRSLGGGIGGMRLASWRRATGDLKLQPLWHITVGNYVLLGVTSSLLALPAYANDILPEEKAEWEQLRTTHINDLRDAFACVPQDQRILLFCHDPTALPFLLAEEAIRARLPQIEQTIIGHLHSTLVLKNSRVLAGMPIIRFMGNTPRKLSTALNEASKWRPFKVRLCPSLAGIQLLRDGGYYRVELDLEGREPAKFEFVPLAKQVNSALRANPAS